MRSFLFVPDDAFTPSAAQGAFAERVVCAFERGEGAVLLDGKMLDIPHLKAARRLIAAVQSNCPA